MAVDADAVRLQEQRLCGRSSVSAETRRTCAGNGRDQLSSGIHPAHHMVLHLREVHVAARVEADFVWFVQRRRERRAAIARVAFLAAARYGRNFVGLQIKAANPMVSNLAEIEGAVRTGHETVRVVDLGFASGTAFSG